MSEEQLYLTGAVIANGIPDSDNDTLNSVEIRTIFTKYTKHLSDIQHDSIDYDGVEVLANWISETDMTIKGNTIPAKSWLATLKVTDPETIAAINDGELTCFSLGSVSSTAKTREAWFINKRISYHDLKSIEDVIPLRISIVDEGANGLPFEVVDYVTYINKTSDKMTDENKTFSLNDIKAIFGLKKEIQEEVTINKAEEETAPAPATETDADKTIEALFAKVDAIAAAVDEIKQAINDNAIDKAEDEDKPEEETETETESAEEGEIEKADEDEQEKKEDEEKIEKENTIEKSTMKPHDIPVEPETVNTFFKRTNRDALGRKIKN